MVAHRFSIRRGLRILAIVLGAILGTGVLAVLALVILLRTGLGDSLLTRYVPGLINPFLADMGLEADIAGIQGPLPERLRLSGLRLKDSQGVWLEAASLEVRLHPAALFDKLLDVELAEVDALRFSRLPVLPPAPATPDGPESPPQPLTLLPEPFRLRLEQLTLRDAVLGPAVAGLPENAEPARLDVSGQGEAASTTASVSLSLLWPQTDPTRLEASLDAGRLDARLDGTLRPVLDYAAPLIPQLQLRENPNLDVRAALQATARLPLLPPDAEAPAQGTLSGALSLADGDKTATLPLALRLGWDGQALEVSDISLSLSATDRELLRLGGSLRLDAAALRADADLSAPELNALSDLVQGWASLLDAETGQAAREGLLAAPGGSVQARASLGAAPDLGNLELSLNLEASRLVWPETALDGVVGDRLTADLALNSPDLRAWSVRELRLEGDGYSLHGNGDVDLAEPLRLSAALAMDIRDLARLAPLTDAGHAGPLVQGPLEAQLRVDGSLPQPLTVKLTARSPHLEFAAGPTASASGVSLEGTVRLDSAPLHFDGGLELKAEAVQGAPLQATVQGNGTLESVRLELDAGLFGLDAEASVRLRLAETPLLDGTARVSVSDWAFLRGLGVPAEADRFSLELRADTARSRQDVDLVARAAGIRLTEPEGRLNSLDGEVRVQDLFGTPGVNGDIRLGAGELAGQSWDKGVITASTGNARELEVIRFGVDVSGQVDLKAAGSFSPQKSQVQLDSLDLDLVEYGLGVKLDRPVAVRYAPFPEVDGLELSLRPSGTVSLDGRLDPDHLALTAAFRDLPLSMARAFSASIPDGTVNGDLNLSGTLVRPRGTLNLTVGDLALDTTDIPATLTVRGELEPGNNRSLARVEATLDGFGPHQAVASGEVPLSFAGGSPRILPNAPLSASLDWQGRLEDLWTFVPLPTMSLSGAGMVRGRVQGTLAAPDIQAAAYVAGGRFEELVQGVLLEDIELEAGYTSAGGSVVRLRAGDGQGGVLAADGSLETGPQGPSLKVNGAFDDLKPLQRDDLSLTLVGDFAVTGPLTDLTVKGNVILDQGEYTFMGNLGGSIPVLENVEDPLDPQTAPKSGSGAAIGNLDISVKAPNRLFVRGRGLSSEWRADMRVTGPLSKPELVGTINPVRGTLELLGRNFAFNDGSVRFAGTTNALLDLSLTYEGPQITAITKVEGSVNAPRLVLTSEPPLPQDEIIAQVLFGKDFSQLSRVETVQAANAARELAGLAGSGGLGALGVMDRLRGDLGLDVLHLGSTPTGGGERRAGRDASVQSRAAAGETSVTTLEAGKYVSDDVYVGVVQGAGSDTTGVRVEVDLRPNVSLDGRTTSESSSVGLNWKKDY